MTDTERLDWLESSKMCVATYCEGVSCSVRSGGLHYMVPRWSGSTYREAIDAAMLAARAHSSYGLTE